MKDIFYPEESAEEKWRNNNMSVGVEAGEVEYGIRYRWRFEAKLVAFVNMILGCFSYAVILVCTVFTIYTAVQTKKGQIDHEIEEMIPGITPDNENYYICLAFIAIFIAFALTSVEFFTANSLRRATSMIAAPHEILKKCVVWRNVSVFLLILSCTALIRGYDQWAVWLWIKFRIFCLMLVWMHIRELKQESRKMKLTKEKYAATAQDLAENKTYG